MRDRLLTRFAELHARRPWLMLAVVVLLTIIFVVLSTNLSVTMRWSDLLPSGDRRTEQFNKIIDEFRSATSIVILVQGEEQRMKEFADRLAPRLLTAADTSLNGDLRRRITRAEEKLPGLADGSAEKKALLREIEDYRRQMNFKLIQRVDYKQELGFIRRHGFMLIKEKDLKNLKDVFKDANLPAFLKNLNDSMEKEYVGDAESISTREKEDNAVIFLDGIANFVETLDVFVTDREATPARAAYAADKLLTGEPYFLSYDEKALILMAIPNFSMTETDLLVKGTDAVQAIVDDLLKEYPDLKAGLTGMVPIGHDEMIYSEQSLGYTSLIAAVAILVLLIVAFRMWIAPFFALFNLIIGIIWAIGLTAVVVGQLNIMTQMMAVILLGLGIDFAIHMISGFTEQRALGRTIREALVNTFLQSGKGIITGGLTTAFAFFTMIISSSRGMKEMGIVTGLGLLAILIETFMLLPVMLVLRERRRDKKMKAIAIPKKDLSFASMGRLAEILGKRYRFTLIGTLIVTALLIWAGLNITFDQNYLNVEPEGLTSIVLQDTIVNKFDMSMDYALVLTKSVEQSRKLAKACRDEASVARTEDISIYLPSREQQERRRTYIEEIRAALSRNTIKSKLDRKDIAVIRKELERLSMNVMEMQDMAFLGGQDKVDRKCQELTGDPQKEGSIDIIMRLARRLNPAGQDELAERLSGFQAAFATKFKETGLQMCSTDPIHLRELPASILDRYSNTRRDHFLVTVYPSENIWYSMDFLQRFSADLERISDSATGMPVIFRALISVIGSDGRKALLLTLVMIFILLVLDFRSTGSALLAMIPLAAGLCWMVGLMFLSGQQFTVMNVMGLPMILGIGIDDGVHIVHRWKHEGKRKLDIIFASTGKAILLTSLTTMLAFGSLIFSIWRGFGHLGAALFVGVGACFLTTILFLSGMIGWLERKK